MADRVMTPEEFGDVVRGLIGSGLAVKRGYFPTDDPLTLVFTASVEALAIANSTTPRRILEWAIDDPGYTDQEWAERLVYLEGIADDATERMREDLIGSAIDATSDET